MKTRLFALIMGVACIVTVIVALPIVSKLLSRRRQRDAYAEAFELVNSNSSAALVAVDRCLEFLPDDLELYKLGAVVALRIGDAERAERYLTPLIENAEPPVPAEAHLGLGALYLSGSDDAEPDAAKAMAHFREALRIDDSLVLAKVGLAFTLAARGKSDEARPYLEAIAALDKHTPGARYASTARLWLWSETLDSTDPVTAWAAFQHLPLAPSVREEYEKPLKMAVAAKVNTPGISSSVRRVCIKALRELLRNKSLDSKQKFLCYSLLADASDRIGDEEAALACYRAAYEMDPRNETAARNMASALLRASARTRRRGMAKVHFDTATAIFKSLLDAGKLDEAERRQVTVALATQAWTDGRADDARVMLAGAGDIRAAEIERMNAADAMEAGDYTKAIAHLTEALKLNKHQPDAQALLESFKVPPEVRDFKVNRSNKFDPRPILSAIAVPRSVPVPLEAANLKMQLDGSTVKPIVTRGGLFYQPSLDLAAGEHKAAITATDVLGLTATATRTFEVVKDTAPPAVLALTPDPDKETGTLEPIIAFRCTDPSGINEGSLKVIFDGKLARKRPASHITVIDRGVYRVDFARAGIRRGQRVPYGAGYFRFSEPLVEGEKYTVQVGVSDVRGHRTLQQWTFTATRGPDDFPEPEGP